MFTMASVEDTISEADILSEADVLNQVIAPGKPDFAPEVARSILEMRFNDEASNRMPELMDKNNKGTISENENAEMEKYLRVGTASRAPSDVDQSRRSPWTEEE